MRSNHPTKVALRTAAVRWVAAAEVNQQKLADDALFRAATNFVRAADEERLPTVKEALIENALFGTPLVGRRVRVVKEKRK
jgi:hypothetical protein